MWELALCFRLLRTYKKDIQLYCLSAGRYTDVPTLDPSPCPELAAVAQGQL